VAAGTNWLASVAVSPTFLSLLKLPGPSATIRMYGVLAVGSWLISYHLVPETKGRSLGKNESLWHKRRADED
jgi:SP family arabinose:H+ symporter-like MFS transporter